MAISNYLKYKLCKPFKSWRNKYLKSMTKKDALKRSLYNQVAGEISSYTNEPAEVIKHKHKLGPEVEKSFNIFQNQVNLTKSSVEDFYKSCSYYLYELPLWNAERNRPMYLYLICSPYLKHNRYKKILDFGGGAGDLCIELAKHNLDVTYCDIGENLYNFSKWRFEKRNLPIKMVKGIDRIQIRDYDCIFSFDAFEHLKDLPAALKMLVSYLRPGGSLVFSGAFSGGTLHLEENDKYNNLSNLDFLMKDCGLIFQDKFAQFYFYKKQIEKVIFTCV